MQAPDHPAETTTEVEKKPRDAADMTYRCGYDVYKYDPDFCFTDCDDPA